VLRANQYRWAGQRSLRLLALLLLLFPLAQTGAQTAKQRPSLELSRAVRQWEFLSAVGTRAGVFGAENGTVEAWVYPLKLLRDFHLVFHFGGHEVPAEALARTITARPESCTILYSHDAFSVRETFFVPVDEPGAVIAIEVETQEPLEVEARFRRDFQLMWPAALGGTYANWDPELRAFSLSEEQKKFFALVGSPSASQPRAEFENNYASSGQSSFRLGVTQRGRDTKLVVLAASFAGREGAEQTYHRLAERFNQLQQQAAEYYRDYLEQTVSLRLPDAELERGYDWARVSVLQGMVNNPFLGAGLVAGYRTSGAGARPGFAWFFGRDALWTVLALDSEGDFAHARAALEFLMKYQREDGKITHEVSQSASFVPWFKDFPYPWASADATPLLVIAANDYVSQSGDAAFARQHWDSIWKAYQFLRSTWDAQHRPKNEGVGHGWVEGGPLLPVKTEFYQSGLGAEAMHALANLARLTGNSAAGELEEEFQGQKRLLDASFWSLEKKIFAFALDRQDKRIDVASVLAAVPMCFGLVATEKASAMISRLADFDHAADWGMRIISSQDERFNPAGYHFGSVWPLFTGWAAVGEYRYHRPLAAYANLRANALLALDGALGHTTEVLSGAYYQGLSTSSPHQIWSSAMIISPMLRGMLGLEVNAAQHTLILSPHLPADWSSFTISRARIGEGVLDLSYQVVPDGIRLEVRRQGAGSSTIEFSPAVSLRAQVAGVEVNDRPAPYHVETTGEDEHVKVRFLASGGTTTVRMRLGHDFGVAVPGSLPALGAPSRNLKAIAESWSATRDRLTMEFSGLAGSEYELPVRGAAEITGVQGAELVKAAGGERLRVRVPGNAAEGYKRLAITVQFAQAPSSPGER